MLIKGLFTVLLSIFVNATVLDNNSKFDSFSLPTQFDKMYKIDDNITTIIISFERHTTKDIIKFLSAYDNDFLEKHHGVFICDISKMPSIIARLFILPKMRDYKQDMLLLYDNKNHEFSKQDDKTTIYSLKNGIVSNINYISTQEEFDKIFK